MIGCRLGGGRLVKKDGRWLGIWTDAQGHRRRRVLSTDHRVAERALALEIRTRDLEANGLLQEQGMERRLSEVRDRYLAELLVARDGLVHDGTRGCAGYPPRQPAR